MHNDNLKIAIQMLKEIEHLNNIAEAGKISWEVLIEKINFVLYPVEGKSIYDLTHPSQEYKP